MWKRVIENILVLCVCLLNVITFLVWMGVMEIFRDMGKIFRVCRYPFFKLKIYKQTNCPRWPYYTLLLIYLLKVSSKNDLCKRFFFVNIWTSIFVPDLFQQCLYNTCGNDVFQHLFSRCKLVKICHISWLAPFFCVQIYHF